MKIEVTKHDIDNGIQNKCQLCPIALAVKRKINGEVIVFGNGISIFITDNISSYRYYKLPQKAKDFIKHFDDGKKVRPFTFEARKTK